MTGINITKLVSATIVILFAIVLLKKTKEEYALFISLFACISLMVASITFLSPLFEYIRSLEHIRESTSYYASLMIKCASCALLCSFGAELCRDCGESLLASKVELCGKCVIIALCLPLIKTVFEYVTKLIY